MEDLNSLFSISGKPSWLKVFPISLQHIFAMLIANVAPALIVASSLKLGADDSASLVQFCMFSAGAATLLQVVGVWRFGCRLPLIMGMNFAFVPVVINIAKEYSLAASYGAVIISGLVIMILGSFIMKIRKYFPPLVTGTTVMTMGISLYPVSMNYMAGGLGNPSYSSWKNWLLALITMSIVLLIGQFAKAYFKALSLFIGIVAGYLIALPMGMVEFSAFSGNNFLTLPRFLPFGIEFIPSAIFTMIMMYLVTSVEVIGDVSSLTIGTLNREASAEELAGAIVGKGLTAILTSCLGALPTASFSQNVGIVTVTKMISKRIFILASVIMIAVGFIPPFGLLMASIPAAVLGGATLSVFAIITINGFKLISQEVLTMRNATILGISLAFGLGLSAAPEAVANAPEAFKTFIASSPVILATLISFVLNIVIPKTSLEDEEFQRKI